jgi:DNA-binding transcriptional LysR family regulator
LTSHPIITYPKTTRPYIMLRQILASAGVASPRIYSNSSLSTIVRMSLDGIGVSVIPPAVIAAELKRGELRVLKTDVALPDLIFTATMAMTPGETLVEPIARMAQQIAAETLRASDKLA